MHVEERYETLNHEQGIIEVQGNIVECLMFGSIWISDSGSSDVRGI